MIILLVGSSGFVGSHLKKRLELLGHTVIAPARGQINIFFQEVDAIINCAAELTDESKMYQSNVDLVQYLLELMRDYRISKFIQIGSSSEYGLTSAARREDLLCTPSNIYDATKLAATALCQGYANRYDMDVCIARPFSLYGDGDKPRKLIPTLYRAYIDHKTVDLYAGSGHDWIFIDDFIDGLILLLNAPASQTKGDIINFGSRKCHDNLEVLCALEDALGGSISVNLKNGKFHPHDVDRWLSETTKAEMKYGWSPKYDLNRGMKEYVMREWFKEDRG